MTRDPRSHPLAPCQEMLWLLHEVGQPGPAYGMPLAARLEGELDREALQRAVHAVVDRHPPLRSVVEVDQGVARLRPLDAGMVAGLVHHDLTSVAEGDRPAAAWEVFRQACCEAFDLRRGPLVRFHLVHEAPRAWTLLAVPHHIVFDGISKANFVRELSQCYRALVAQEEPGLAPLRSSYAEHAREEGDRLPGLVSQLAEDLGALGPVETGPQLLPFDRSRPAELSGMGGWVNILLDEPLHGRLAQVAQTSGASMFQLLVAALATLLFRYGNRQRVTVTAAMGTRTPETMDLIGFFVNNIPVGVEVADGPTFSDLLARVSTQVRRASKFRRVPLSRIIPLVNPPRIPGVNPLFQVGLAYQAEVVEPLELPGLKVEWQMLLPNFGAKCDLLFQVLDRHSSLEVRLEHAVELFDEATAERVAGHFRSLLEGVAADPARPLSALPLLNGDERRLVAAVNETARRYPAERCTHELFEAQARRTPDAPAVSSGGRTLSYAELDARAERLASHLRALGVGTEGLVGICLERSVDLVVALLGVWKAGGAYVPLDPGYPAERLSIMLADADPAVLVTQTGLAERLPAHPNVVLLDGDWPTALAGREGEAPAAASHVTPSNLAYVIFTSGSTGRPKGVMIEHRALVNFLSSMAREPGMGSDDVVLAVTSLSFDIAILELMGPLLVGGHVVVAPGDTFLDGRQLAAALASSGATIVQATPVTWQLLLDAGWNDGRGLKAICGGEALSWPLASRLLASGVDLWNLYGPTETTVWSSLLHLGEGDGDRAAEQGSAVPVGRPLANTSLHVLDPELQEVPVGIWGELYIGGDGLARGYLGQPELTREKFVPDPFGPPGARLYRTGDRARRRADGIVEFGGRADLQVKLRGLRIELGDIEDALLRHPSVHQAAVALHGEQADDKRLVAYLVAVPPPAPEELRSFLLSILPPHMVPSAFVTLDALPLTPNGKVDRKALIPPERPPAGPDDQARPRTRAEALVAGIWEEVLPVERVGVDDDFFELGGNSLLAIQVVSRLRDVFGVEIGLRELFDSPTVAALAKEVEAAGAASPAT